MLWSTTHCLQALELPPSSRSTSRVQENQMPAKQRRLHSSALGLRLLPGPRLWDKAKHMAAKASCPGLALPRKCQVAGKDLESSMASYGGMPSLGRETLLSPAQGALGSAFSRGLGVQKLGQHQTWRGRRSWGRAARYSVRTH